MKKILALLFVTFIIFSTFVSAQDTAKQYKPVTFIFDKVTLLKDSTPTDKEGHFELTFSEEPGIIFFRDLDKLSLMKIVLGQHISDQPLEVWYKGLKTAATAMCFMATVHEMDIVFATVLLNDKDQTVYAFGITLEHYSILLKVKE